MRYFSLIFFALIFFSCNDKNVTEPQFQDEYSKWKALGIKNYSIDQQLLCFCPGGGKEYKVIVINNVVSAVIDPDTKKPLNDNWRSRFKTIDEVFEFVHLIKKDSVAYFNVDYNTFYGFPEHVFVDYNANIADEEMGYNIEDLNFSLLKNLVKNNNLEIFTLPSK